MIPFLFVWQKAVSRHIKSISEANEHLIIRTEMPVLSSICAIYAYSLGGVMILRIFDQKYIIRNTARHPTLISSITFIILPPLSYAIHYILSD